MAVKVNGALIVEQVYEFGVDYGAEIVPCLDYDQAKRISDRTNYPIKMCCVYKTEWMDAK